MSLEFITQPRSAFRLGDFLKTSFEKPEWTGFRAAIAFVKRSGTKHIKSGLEAFSSRGGSVSISVGVDSGGTSAEGLTDLLAALDGRGRIYIFHNANSSTFHPKIYLFKNATSAEVVIGSGNLTEGGLFTNYEANVLVKLDLAVAEHADFLRAVEEALDDWSTLTEGLCQLLDQTFLDQLVAHGQIPDEVRAWGEDKKPGGSGAGGEEALFKRHTVQKAPKVAGSPEIVPEEDEESEDDEGLVVPVSSSPVPAQGGQYNAFIMTLQNTDVGVGQTSKGTQRRSPEIFIPLSCRDFDPDFWGWPNLFVPDPNWTGRLDQHGRGKMDRAGVMVRLGGSVFPVNIWYNPDKKDQRIRSEHIRSAGVVDDILYVERSDGKNGFAYYIEVIPKGTTKHATYLPLCTQSVRNSKKKWNYLNRLPEI